MPKMPYPYATGMIPRLASETLSGGGLPGGWMCLHVTPPVPDEKGGQTGADGAGAGGVGAGGAGVGGVGAGGVGAGGVGAGGVGAGGVGAGGVGAGGVGAGGIGAGGVGGGYAGGAVGGAGAGAGAGYVGGPGYAGGVGGAGYAGGSGAGGAGTGAGTGTVPAGYIRYNGQLLTIDQYQQAIAGGGTGSGSTLSRRDMMQPETGNILVDTLLHKRQTTDDSTDDAAGAGAGAGNGAGAGADGGAGAGGDATDPTPVKKKKAPTKILMCINGDPAVPPIKFDTVTGLRIRDASDKQDGVVAITNLPRYNTPWMPFLPTAEMWAEQQDLMIAQEDIIEKNTTTGPPPAVE